MRHSIVSLAIAVDGNDAVNRWTDSVIDLGNPIAVLLSSRGMDMIIQAMMDGTWNLGGIRGQHTTLTVPAALATLVAG